MARYSLSIEEFVHKAENGEKGRHVKAVAVIAYVAASTSVSVQLYYYWQSGNVFALSIWIFLGILSGDFLSGLVHWALDTYGSIDTPIVGKAMILPDRLHHIEPTAMARCDTVTTLGDQYRVAAPLMCTLAYFLCSSSPEHIHRWYNMYVYTAFVFLFGAMYNLFHKWAHTHSDLPPLVQMLQALHLSLPRSHHLPHHHPPYTVRYCLVTGWANYPLDYINFWRTLEWIIEKLTGCKPRSDDIVWYTKKEAFVQKPSELGQRLTRVTI